MNNVESLQTNFPDAVSIRRFMTRVRDAIEPLGFDRSNSFPITSVCRDELAQSLVGEVTEFWRRPFDLGGLAGLPPGGEETWQAGLSHIPDSRGRGHLLVFGASHIGIAPDGTLGRVQRHGQADTTTACGALGGIVAAITAGAEARAEIAETEAGKVKRAVLQVIEPGQGTEILPVTVGCAQAINDSIWESLESLSVHTTTDIVVVSGVQIHLHDDFDQFSPVAATFKGADGELVPLKLG